MLKKAKNIAAGMDLFELYRLMGLPYREIRDSKGEIKLVLYRKKRLFKKLTFIKVKFREGFVYEVKETRERNISIENV